MQIKNDSRDLAEFVERHAGSVYLIRGEDASYYAGEHFTHGANESGWPVYRFDVHGAELFVDAAHAKAECEAIVTKTGRKHVVLPLNDVIEELDEQRLKEIIPLLNSIVCLLSGLHRLDWSTKLLIEAFTKNAIVLLQTFQDLTSDEWSEEEEY